SARASRRTHNLVMQFVVQKNTPKIAVVIELTKSVETLFPLLDHLRQHGYSKIEVVVIVKHTAGSKAQAKLNYYKRKNHFKNLKVIKHKKGMNQIAIVKKFVKSQFVMQLEPPD